MIKTRFEPPQFGFCKVCNSNPCRMEKKTEKAALGLAESLMDILVLIAVFFVGITFFAGMIYLYIVVPIFLTVKTKSVLDVNNNISAIFTVCALLLSIPVGYVFFRGLQSFRRKG